MIQLQRHQITSALSVEDIHTRIKERLTNTIGLALSPSQNFLFSGTLTKTGFTITPIQKGRIFPMPRLHGTYHELGKGTDIVIVVKAGLKSTLDIIMWFIVGLGISTYAVSSYGIYAIGLMSVPLLYIGLQLRLLHREARLGMNLLIDLLSEDIQDNP